MQVQLASLAAAKDLRLDRLEVAIRGSFDRAGGRLPGVPNRGIVEIRYETHIGSPESPTTVRALAEEAERHCYVLNTLKRAVKIFGRIFHNDNLLLEVAHSPEG